MAKVLLVNNEKIVNIIETFTRENTFPNVIQFIPYEKGGFITSVENLENPVFKKVSDLLKGEIIKEELDPKDDAPDKVLKSYCREIDYEEPKEMLNEFKA